MNQQEMVERDEKVRAILNKLMSEDYTFEYSAGWHIKLRGHEVGFLASRLEWMLTTGPIHPRFVKIQDAIEAEFGTRPEIKVAIEYRDALKATSNRVKALNIILGGISNLRVVKIDQGFAVRTKNDAGILSPAANLLDDLFLGTNLGVISYDLRTIYSESIGREFWELVAEEMKSKFHLPGVRLVVGKHV